MTLEDANKSANEEAVEGGFDATLKSLFDEAVAVAAHSYSPYSGLKVGAALKLSNGEIVTGTNVENVSYGLTICAERGAVAQAVSRFGPTIRIEAVAIANLNKMPCPPCGACRQFIAEFIEPEAPVVFPVSNGVRVMPFSQVLPLALDLKLK
jgi:cytidine deaminase